jgi:hypothetical protein
MSPYQNKAAMQEHIPQWQASHLTQAEYCKTHGIKPCHVLYWFRMCTLIDAYDIRPF